MNRNQTFEYKYGSHTGEEQAERKHGSVNTVSPTFLQNCGEQQNYQYFSVEKKGLISSYDNVRTCIVS